MTLFQIIAITLMAGLLAIDLRGWLTRRSVSGIRLTRIVVWVAAIGAIAWPNGISTIARSMGIGRGTDLVLYGYVLVSLVVGFRFYAWCTSLERRITELARHEALRTAERGAPTESVEQDGEPAEWEAKPR